MWGGSKRVAGSARMTIRMSLHGSASNRRGIARLTSCADRFPERAALRQDSSSIVADGTI